MTTLTKVKRAYRLFSNEYSDKALVRANVIKYLAALEYLGNRWILATPVQRKGN